MAIAAAACLSPALPAPRPAISASSSAFLSNGGNGLLAKRASLRVAGRSRRRGGGGGLEVKCLFGLGVPELAVIAGVAALVFGPKKLPEIGRSIGKTVKSFQQAAKEFETEIKKSPEELSDTPTEKPISAGENQKQENAGNLEVSSQKES